MTPKLLIKFPTRQRLERFERVFTLYQEMCGYANVKFIVSCDSDDPTRHDKKLLLSKFPNTKLAIGANGSKIEAVNADMEGVDFDVCLLASDDMHPEVHGFGKIIMDRMRTHYPDTDGVLWFNDGFTADKLNTLVIVGKKYYDRFGYLYHPSYKSLCCDTEFTYVSKTLKRCTYFDEVIIRHQHFRVPGNGVKRDKLYNKNARLYKADRENYLARKKEGFKP